MKFHLPTEATLRAEREAHKRNWQPCFLLLPRRARNNKGRLLEFMVIGRAMRREIPRDGDGKEPYVWQYMDRAEFVAMKLVGGEA